MVGLPDCYRCGKQPCECKDGVTLYHADCRDVLPLLEAGSVDLVLTDPPFFMPATHYQSRVHWQRCWGDTTILRDWWSTKLEHAVRVLRRTGHCLVFCNHESYSVFYPEMYGRFDFLKAIVWDKQHVGLGRVWRNQHELIIAARWETSVFVEDGKLRADVLRRSATPSTKRGHPVEKPSELLADLVEPTTGEGGMVLDPFAGSGTTGRACKDLGRKCIMVEIEEKYCRIAARRLEQGVLFT